MKFIDADGNAHEATAEDILRMYGLGCLKREAEIYKITAARAVVDGLLGSEEPSEGATRDFMCPLRGLLDRITELSEDASRLLQETCHGGLDSEEASRVLFDLASLKG